MIRDDQVGRLARMGMSVVLQPLFLTDFGDTLLDLLSQFRDLGSFFFRMRSLVAAGIPVVGSSDRPVAAGSPLRGIQAMVERTTSDGNVFGPDERLSPSEALEFYTVGGAWATHAEHDVGVIAARRLADLVVLGDDPTTVDPGRIGAIDVVATLVGGQAVHDPSALFAGAPPPAGAGAGPTGPDGHA
jgi:predicted amidohydrolase YtcJ